MDEYSNVLRDALLAASEDSDIEVTGVALVDPYAYQPFAVKEEKDTATLLEGTHAAPTPATTTCDDAVAAASTTTCDDTVLEMEPAASTPAAPTTACSTTEPTTPRSEIAPSNVLSLEAAWSEKIRPLATPAVPDAGVSDNEMRLRKAVETGEFDLRSALGQQWTRALKNDKNLQVDYAEHKSREDRRLFRNRWAQATLKKAVEKREHIQKVIHQELSLGEYLPFGMVVKREGGWKDASAIAAAETYFEECVALGNHWVSYNSMTKRGEVLYLRRQVRDVFENAWSHSLANTSEVDAASNADTGINENNNSSPKPAKGANKRATTECDDEAKRAKKDFSSAMSAATRERNKFQRALQGADSLLATIEKDSSWSWAHTGVLKEVSEAKADLQACVSVDQATQDFFACMGAQALKRKHTQEALLSSFTYITSILPDKVNALSNAADYFRKQHGDRMRSSGSKSK